MTRAEFADQRELQRQWQSEDVPASIQSAARRRVDRERRRQLLTVALEAASVLAVGAWSVRTVMREPEPFVVLTMFVFWTFAAVLIGFGIVKRRGTWSSDSHSTMTYLSLSVERARRAEQIARFALKLMAVWFLAAVLLLAWRGGIIQEGQSLAALIRHAIPIFLLTFGVLGILAERARRRARRDVARLGGIIHAFRQSEPGHREVELGDHR